MGGWKNWTQNENSSEQTEIFSILCDSSIRSFLRSCLFFLRKEMQNKIRNRAFEWDFALLFSMLEEKCMVDNSHNITNSFQSRSSLGSFFFVILNNELASDKQRFQQIALRLKGKIPTEIQINIQAQKLLNYELPVNWNLRRRKKKNRLHAKRLRKPLKIEKSNYKSDAQQKKCSTNYGQIDTIAAN